MSPRARSPLNLRSASALSLGLLAIVLSACAGPRDPLEVGIKEVPTDVILGAQIALAPPPGPALNPNPGFPSFIGPSPPENNRLLPAPSPSPIPIVPCPSAHPFDAPKMEATNRATKPPVTARYPFRNKGTFDYMGPRPAKGSFPEQSFRSILGSSVDPSTGTYSFSVAEDVAGTITTTTYFVQPESAVPNDAGIYITAISRRLRDGSTDRFAPTPGIKILQFPAVGGLAWDSSGTDPLTGTSMVIHGRVGIDIPDGPDPDTLPDNQAKARIDACGVPIDAWYVVVTGPPSQPAGRIVGPNQNLNLLATYAIATQFGGFSVYDKTEITGMDGANTVAIRNEATVSSEPKAPPQ